MPYRVVLQPRALKSLARLQLPIRQRVADVIDGLAINPRPTGARPLQGHAPLMRVRAGDYRVVYRVNDDILEVLVVHVGHRRDVYRGL